jgi:hypothetical protein
MSRRQQRPTSAESPTVCANSAAPRRGQQDLRNGPVGVPMRGSGTPATIDRALQSAADQHLTNK